MGKPILRTILCDIFEIEYPIILAGMGGASGPELAAAVSNAGGLGVLGAAGLGPEELSHWIERTRKLTSKPFGVDTLLPSGVPTEGAVMFCSEPCTRRRLPINVAPRPVWARHIGCQRASRSRCGGKRLA